MAVMKKMWGFCKNNLTVQQMAQKIEIIIFLFPH